MSVYCLPDLNLFGTLFEAMLHSASGNLMSIFLGMRSKISLSSRLF
jgi:hypothetical protein